MRSGYTYEYIGPDNIATDRTHILEGGIGAPSYKALIFNKQSIISVEAAEALLRITSDGIPLVFIGSSPNQAFPIADQSKLNATMERVLSGNNIHHLDAINEVPALLSRPNIEPRVSLSCSSNPVYSVYRANSDVDYVFLFNDQSKDTECAATITVQDVTPVELDAWTGLEVPMTASYVDESTLSIPLSMKGNETRLIALRRSSKPSGGYPETVQRFTATDSKPLNLTSWNLTIEDWHSAPDWFAVETGITNHTLHNVPLRPWNQLNASLLPVSGIGHYVTSFIIPSSLYNTSAALLQLPLIQHTARVFLNGDWLGPIDPVNPKLLLRNLQAGKEYEIRIDVTTTLLNRVKTDAKHIRMIGIIPEFSYINKTYAEYGLVGQAILKWGQLIDSR